MSGGFYGGGDSGSQSNGAGSKKAIRPIRTLMISQILSAGLEYDNPDGPVIIDDHPVNNAVLCVELLDVIEANNGKRVKVGDATGTLELRLPAYGNENTDLESHYNQFGNLYGHFRVFQGKPNFDFSRFDFNIPAYQFLYHEVEAARESYHYQGLVSLDRSLGNESEGLSEKHASNDGNEQPMFVEDSGFDEDLKERILGIIRGFEDTGDGVTVDYIAAELSMDEAVLRKVLSHLENEAKVYEIDNSWRVN